MHSRNPIIAPLHRLMTFAQYVKVRRMISEIAKEPQQSFWTMTLNLLMDAAAIEWAKVFGSRGDDTHWTRVVSPEQHDQTRADLLGHLDMTVGEWLAYRDSIVRYRDQMAAHHDLAATLPSYPQYDKALEAAYFMFGRMRPFADQDWLGGIPIELDRWSTNVAGNMSAIVRKAFAGSAALGSNTRG
jgi:hypothetical protein